MLFKCTRVAGATSRASSALPLLELYVSFLLLARFVARENVSFRAVEIVVYVCGSCC